MVTSIAEARDHISRIRKSRGLDVDGGNNMNAEDLHAALEMLSEQLYQRPTRFIMELIQNADDNHYEDQAPELSLTLRGRSLHIACNETGFTKGNIDAICRIHKSTKTNDKSGEGYVGEKGIGFKSVFKVADVVWISSGHYSFKFDKRTTLGMVTPIWESFPVETHPGSTEFYLQLSEDADLDGITKELIALQPSLLLFLRRLRKINITVPGQPLISLCCGMSPAGRILSRNGDPKEYVVHEHTVTNMPGEERRPGITSTRLLLAFPMDKDNEPVLDEQDVFAFLPIRSYGFKFLIQADFLLVASREDIDQSKLWNRRLLDGIVDAFIDVISPPHHPYLEFQWPRYIPRGIHPGTFLWQLEDRIRQSILDREVILSSEGVFEKPLAVRHIPSKFLHKDREPMFSYIQAPYKPLSFRYTDAAVDRLLLFAIGQETPEDFVKRLNYLVQSRSAYFQHLPEEWHARLATILCKQGGGSRHRSLRKTKMIPLRNGPWVAAEGNTVFFDKNQSDLAIPDGLDVLTVDPRASMDASRRQLFVSLGVQECNNVEICKAIIRRHGRLPHMPVSTGAMVQQIRFLYSASSELLNSGQCISEEELWFLNTNGVMVRGGQLYLNDPGICVLDNFFQTDLANVSFLHLAYTEGLLDSEKTKFHGWLRQTFNMSSIPRLCTSSRPPRLMTSEFEHMIHVCSSKHVLKLLVDHWWSYSPLMSDSVLTKLKDMDVSCQDRISRPLHQTYLPLEALTTNTPVPNAVPFLEVSDPSNPRWEKLEKFGVGIEENLAFHLDCLQGFQRNVPGRPPLDTLQRLYEKVEDECYLNVQIVRSRFETERLIYLPPTDQLQIGSWHRLADCIWAAPKGLQGARPLKRLYGYRKKLFKDTLRIRDASIEDVIQELLHVQADSERSDYIKSLLTLLNYYIKRGRTPSSLSELKNAATFPIRSGIPGDSVSLVSPKGENWFIADYPYLRTEFEGKVGLLDVVPDQCRGLDALFKALGMQGKYLSVAVKQVLRCRGDTVSSDRFAQLLQTKAAFLSRLAPKIDRERVLEQLLHAEAHEVTAIDAERYVEIQEDDGVVAVRGRPSHGDVVVDMVKKSANHDVPRIYIAEGGLSQENFPPHQLCKELCRLCNIEDKLQSLVAPILRIHDPRQVQLLLDIEKIGVVEADVDDMEENDDDMNEEDDCTASSLMVESSLGPQAASFSCPGINGEMDGGDVFSSITNSLLSTLPKQHSQGGSHTDASVSIPMDMSSSTIQARSPAQYEQDQRIGFEGEKHVFETLQKLDENLDFSIWTSSLRERAGHAPFAGDEAEHTDFTVTDPGNKLASYFLRRDDFAAPASGEITYHIEVKSAAGPLTSTFFMSHRQLQKARRYTFPVDGSLPTHVYLIARVYDVKSGDPHHRFYADPWRLWFEGGLEIKPMKGPYAVSAKE